MFYDFNGYNKILFTLINKATNIPLLPSFLKKISFLFNISNFAVYYFLSLSLIVYYLNKSQKLNIPIFNLLYSFYIRIGICYAFTGIIYTILKFSMNFPRPFCSLNSDEFISILNLSNERCLSSFPSAHIALAIMLAYYLWPFAKLKSKIFLFLTIVIVATSRITLAMHYPSDLLYSTFIIFIIIFMSEKIYLAFQNNLIDYVRRFIIPYVITNAKSD